MIKVHIILSLLTLSKWYITLPLPLDNKNVQNAYYPKQKQQELNRVAKTTHSINNQEKKNNRLRHAKVIRAYYQLSKLRNY